MAPILRAWVASCLSHWTASLNSTVSNLVLQAAIKTVSIGLCNSSILTHGIGHSPRPNPSSPEPNVTTISA